MQMVKVVSYLLNSVQFNYYTEKTDKHGNKFKTPVGDPIVIEGRNPYFQRTHLHAPHVITEVSFEDWEYIKSEMKHSPELKSGLLFAGKTDKDTIATAAIEGKSVPKFGNEPVEIKEATIEG